MTTIVDAAPLVALADRNDPLRETVAAALRAARGALVVPAPVSAEVDYLLGTRLGRAARLAFLRDVAAGRFVIEGLDAIDHVTVLEVEERYADLNLGLADCALVVLAAKHETLDLVTFDERDFRAVRPLQGGSFRLLPGDGER